MNFGIQISWMCNGNRLCVCVWVFEWMLANISGIVSSIKLDGFCKDLLDINANTSLHRSNVNITTFNPIRNIGTHLSRTGDGHHKPIAIPSPNTSFPVIVIKCIESDPCSRMLDHKLHTHTHTRSKQYIIHFSPSRSWITACRIGHLIVCFYRFNSMHTHTHIHKLSFCIGSLYSWAICLLLL